MAGMNIMCMCYIFNVASLSHFISRSFFSSFSIFIVDIVQFYLHCRFFIALLWTIHEFFQSTLLLIVIKFSIDLTPSNLLSFIASIPTFFQAHFCQLLSLFLMLFKMTWSELFLSIYHILNRRTNKEAHIGA